jgi:hypothetical protein
MPHSRIQKSHGDFVLTRSFRIASLLATTAIVCATGAARAEQTGPRPLFAVIPHAPTEAMVHKRSAFPATWTYKYTYGGSSYTETWIGGNPSTASSETVTTYMIPLKLTYSTTTEDATAVMTKIKKSPIFGKKTDFTFGGTDIGKTQYEDAFAKANVWSIGGSATGYHVLLKYKAEPTQSITIPSAQGSIQSPFGTSVIVTNINWFDPVIKKLIASLGIPSNAFPMFVTTETYLYSGNYQDGCCIGGYHSVDASGQPYGMFTYIQESGDFSQDVSALSHELGEWVDDPYTANNSPCGIYEVGDPLEGDANYGDYPYKVGSFTYHLQDLAMPPYFGAPAGVSLGNMDTLQGTKLSVCANGS